MSICYSLFRFRYIIHYINLLKPGGIFICTFMKRKILKLLDGKRILGDFWGLDNENNPDEKIDVKFRTARRLDTELYDT